MNRVIAYTLFYALQSTRRNSRYSYFFHRCKTAIVSTEAKRDFHAPKFFCNNNNNNNSNKNNNNNNNNNSNSNSN